MIIFYYIFKQMISLTFSITALILVMIWLIQSLRQIDLVLKNGASFSDFLYLSILPSPLWIMMILPIGSLIAVIMLFNRLHNEKETLMIRYSGTSVIQIIKPIFLFGLINLVLLSLVNFYIVPKAYSLFKSKQFELRNNISQILLREGVFIDIQKGLTILIDKKSTKYNLNGIFIFDKRNKDQQIDTSAKQGKLIISNNGMAFHLFDGQRRVVDVTGKIISELSFNNYSMNVLNKNDTKTNRWLDSNEKTISELFKEKDPNSSAEAHFWLALPILSLTLPLQALILLICMTGYRKNQIFNISSSLLIALIIFISLISMRRIMIQNPSTWISIYIITIFPIFISLIFGYILDIKNKFSISKRII